MFFGDYCPICKNELVQTLEIIRCSSHYTRYDATEHIISSKFRLTFYKYISNRFVFVDTSNKGLDNPKAFSIELLSEVNFASPNWESLIETLIFYS